MSNRKTIPGFLLLLIGGICLAACPTGICHAQGHGHGGGHGGGGHGGGGHGGGGHGHDSGSSSFFGLGPGGFTYGYADDNFGLVIGPVGGGYYRDGGGYYGGGCRHAAPIYSTPLYPTPVYSAPVYSIPAESPPVVVVQPASQLRPAASTARQSPLIESNVGAREFLLHAENAFFAKDYQAAAGIIRHAMVEDSANGKLHLFNSQILFAIGEYEGATEALGVAMQHLERGELGYIVENFRSFYSNGDYVKQMDALVAWNKENPGAVAPRVLRGYHYLYLGHPQSAQKQFQRALDLDPENEIAREFMTGFEEITAPSPDDDEDSVQDQ